MGQILVVEANVNGEILVKVLEEAKNVQFMFIRHNTKCFFFFKIQTNNVKSGFRASKIAIFGLNEQGN